MKNHVVSVILVILVLCLLGGAVDLFWPLHRDLRDFDPIALGDLETAMWRSYYDRRPFRLFLELADMLRTQYHFPFLRSYLGAYHATRAAFVFKDGKQRADYERALPSLEAYFSDIRTTGNISFDVQQASNAELGWWIVHRERNKYPGEALAHACATAAAALFQVPPDSTLAHGRMRVEAMDIRDSCAARGYVGEEDWAHIDALLRGCYISLRSGIALPDQKAN